MNVITNNLNEILKDYSSARKMAEALNTSPTTLNEYLKGRIPPSDFVVRICEQLNISFEWILTGKGGKQVGNDNDDTSFIYVPLLLDVKASAGNGYIVDMEHASRTISFRRDWISRHNISANNLSAIHVSGDSMYPTLINGDILLVDSSQTQPLADRIFVVSTEDGVIVKRSGGLNGSKLLLISDNPTINDREIDLNRESISIIGRVVWYGRNM